MRGPRIAGMAQSFDQSLLVEPAQMAHCCGRRDIGTDADTFDRHATPFAIGDEQVQQHIPGRFSKQAARKVTRAQPTLTIKGPGSFEEQIVDKYALGHALRQPLAIRRGRLSPRVPRLAERSKGPGTSHAPSGRIISSGGRPM
jgi:hypothetical protein